MNGIHPLSLVISMFCKACPDVTDADPIVDVRCDDDGITVMIAENVGPHRFNPAGVTWTGGNYHGPLSALPA